MSKQQSYKHSPMDYIFATLVMGITMGAKACGYILLVACIGIFYLIMNKVYPL